MQHISRSASTLAVTVLPTTVADKPTLANLMQLYLYDLSVVEGRGVGDDGVFRGPALDDYWSGPDCAAFLIRADDWLAGFALMHATSRVQQPFDGRVIEALFVLRRERRCGIGRAAATQLFDAFPGSWEVASHTANVPAHCFWRSVIQDYTGGHYDEAWHNRDGWRGHIQTFTSPNRTNGGD